MTKAAAVTHDALGSAPSPLSRKPRQFQDRLPNLVVVGAQKAATSTIAVALAEHPDVFMAPGEFHDFTDPAFCETTVEDLARLFPRAAAERSVRGFKCASYFGSPEVPQRLHAALDVPKIVVALRNPVRRTVSAWYWFVRNGLAPLMDHNEGIGRILRGEAEGAQWRHARDILDWSRYSVLLPRWLTVFPPDAVHIIVYMDIDTEPQRVATDLCDFLAIERRIPGAALDRRHNDSVYSIPRLRWLALRNRWLWHRDDHGIWRSERPRRGLAAVADGLVVAADRVALRRIFPTRRPVLTDSLERQLLDYYAEDIRYVERLLDRQLPQWWAG